MDSLRVSSSASICFFIISAAKTFFSALPLTFTSRYLKYLSSTDVPKKDKILERIKFMGNSNTDVLTSKVLHFRSLNLNSSKRNVLFNSIIREFNDIIKILARQFANGDKAFEEELIVEGQYGIYKAIEKYKTTEGTSFKTFGTLYAKFYMMKYIEYLRGSTSHFTNDESLLYRIEDKLAMAHIEDGPKINDLIDKALIEMKRTNEKLPTIFRLRIQGHTFKEIATMMGDNMSQEAIRTYFNMAQDIVEELIEKARG